MTSVLGNIFFEYFKVIKPAHTAERVICSQSSKLSSVGYALYSLHQIFKKKS